MKPIDIKRLDYNSRVNYGKMIESKIIQVIQNLGFDIKSSSKYEDIYDKIDAYILFKDKSKNAFIWRSLQIKYRFKERYILLETLFISEKNKENIKLNGRDMKGKAQLYACLIKFRLLCLCDKEELNAIATDLTHRMIRSINNNPSMTTIYKDKHIVKIVKDPYTKLKKIIVLICPHKLKSAVFYDVDFFSINKLFVS